MRGREFLDVATYLDALDSDASARTRTGRYYYAAFLESRGWCEQFLGYRPTGTGREHADVPGMLVRIDASLQQRLVFLKRYRNAADYALDTSLLTIMRQEESARVLSEAIIARPDELAVERLEPPLEPERR